jgi:uncharacterized membrane protein
MHAIDIVTLMMAGLLVGNELTVSLFINPVMRQLSDESQRQALSLFAALLGRVMPFWYALCLVLFLVETYLRRGEPASSFLLSASVLWVAIIVWTILVLVPINNRIAGLAEHTRLKEWLPEHTRWERLHRIRIFLLLVALALVTHALV